MKKVFCLFFLWVIANEPTLFAAGGFVSTTSPSVARVGATATLLPDGTVLVAGGGDDTRSTVYSSAVRYNPTTETWAAAGSMSGARGTHTATLLLNGKVLVTGGGGIDGVNVASAEIYDPVMNNWSSTGSLGAGRAFHEATLLPNGKVLVTGGNGASGGSSSISSCEMYDPSTGVWSPTASMSKARGNGHTATLLTNGKVLVTGGWLSGSLAHCELYDPATGTWSPTGSLIMGRHTHPAILLPNGKVMVVGGYGTGITRATEIYDPATGLWTAATSMISARNSHSVILLTNNKILAAGGNSSLGTAEIYDINTGTWSATGALITPRAYGQVAALLTSGRVLVAGGKRNPWPDAAAPLVAAEIYIPDMGPPTLNISTPANLTSTTVTLNGTVNPNGTATTAQFEYGTTTSFGNSASITLTPNDNIMTQSVNASLSALAPSTLYYYRLKATNGSGTSITMTGSFVTLYQVLEITEQPSSRYGYAGQSTTFNVLAAGTGTVSYQWRKNGVNIPTETSSSLTLSPLNYRSAAEYDVAVTDDLGSVISDPAELSVLSPAPNVNISHGDTSVALGGGLTFTAAVATGIPPFTYQWRRNGTAIAKATNSTLVLTNIQRTQEGVYDVVVKNGHGVDVSNPARLSLPPVVTVNTSPESTDVNPAGTATFTVNVPGATAWQWLKNGISIKEAITSTLNVPNVDASSAGLYSVTVTTPNGKVTTAPAQLRVNDSGLLIYKLTGTGKAYAGTVATNAAISGYLVLDRAGQRGGLIIGSKSGSQNIHRAEIHEDLDTQSTGPVPKSQTVVSELVAGEFALWMNGTDGLITISKTDKAVGPATMKGFTNSIDLGSNVRMETVSLTLTLDAVNSTPSRLFQETVEQAMSRISQDMQAKGSALIER